MGRDVRQQFDLELDTGVEEVWNAIATGPGIDSWFMGRTEIADGHVRTAFADCTITESQEGQRFAYTSSPADDGRFIAFDFLVEGRANGSTALRVVASGFLPGDDWQDEYVAMGLGHALFFRTLSEYLAFFAPRIATPVTAWSATVADWPAAWSALAVELGGREVGDAVTVRIGGRVAGGTVYFVNDQTLAVRTSDALYRFVRQLDGPMLGMHHLFVPRAETAADWTSWLHRVIG